MQYDPIKKSLGRFFTGPVFMRKIFFCLLDMLLLRTWHVKRAIRRISGSFPDNASVLDAGAGFGQYTWRMKRMNPHWQIKTVDIDEEHVEDCKVFFRKAGFPDIICEAGDLVRLRDKDQYNIILCVDVMEHIHDDTAVFSNFHFALKQNGILLISTPSDKGGSDVHGYDEHSFIDEHVRDGYGMEEIRNKLLKAGFQKVSVSYTYGAPGNVSWKLSMKYPIKILNRSKLFFIILPFYYLVTFPFALILNFFDLRATHKTGTGLLVTAYK
jgi:SAM-dependent methyltransferase